MEILLLGPVEVHDGARDVRLSPRMAAALAALALNVGRPVPVERLLEAVWGHSPPTTARQQVFNCVSQLRRAVGERIDKAAAGYTLRLAPQRVDIVRFEEAVAAARAATAEGCPASAAERYAEALGLWRGPALGGVVGLPAQAARLEEQRLAVFEERLRAELALGRHAAVSAELSVLVEAHPDRERLVELLMLALYRCGRKTDALRAYERSTRRLAEEYGLDPGDGLRRMQLAVLRCDPALDYPADRPARSATQPASRQTTQPAVRQTTQPAARQATQPATQPATRPAQLPLDVAGFTGRDAELRRLDAALAAAGHEPTGAAVCVVSGMAGVGKTALATHWAHRVADRFPDGQLHVNLRGFHPAGAATPPAEALRGFLAALGTPPERVPGDLDTAAALYRSLLAGKRMLIVLDNARDAEQVRPLLPGTPSCFALVTSRSHLTGIVVTDAAHPIALGLFPADQARDLLARRLGGERTTAEPDAVEAIIRACAGLPLALAIVAARTRQTGFPLASVAAELAGARGRLDALDCGEASSRLRSVFSWSTAALTPPAARLFRLLGALPGPDVSAAAAASLVGADPVRCDGDGAAQLLHELTRANLLTEHVPGRFTLHDLLRAYAVELVTTVEPQPARHAAVARLFDHYRHTAHLANRLQNPHRDRCPLPLDPPVAGTAPEQLATGVEATAWFTAEVAVLLAAVDQAVAGGFDAHAWQLAWSLDTFLYRQGRSRELAAVWRAVLPAAERLADPLVRATTRRTLAYAETLLGNYAEAHAQGRLALEGYALTDDRAGEAAAHHNLAFLWQRQHRLDAALHHAHRALALFRTTTGNQRWEATVLNGIACCHTELGDFAASTDYSERALALFEQLGDRDGTAATLDNLGLAYQGLGEYPRAVECFRRSLEQCRVLGERYYEACVLGHLGDACRAAADPDAARAAWQQAVEVLDELGHRDVEAIRVKLHALDAARPEQPRVPVGDGRPSVEDGHSPVGDGHSPVGDGHSPVGDGRASPAGGR